MLDQPALCIDLCIRLHHQNLGQTDDAPMVRAMQMIINIYT